MNRCTICGHTEDLMPSPSQYTATGWMCREDRECGFRADSLWAARLRENMQSLFVHEEWRMPQ